MATNVTTPASLAYTGGTLRHTRLAPARLRFTASTTLVSSKDSNVTGAATVPELDRLLSLDRLLNQDGTPSLRFMSIWQKSMEAIEDAFQTVNSRVDDNAAILARLSAAETLAEAANDNANTAAVTAETVKTATSQTLASIDPVFQTEFDDRVTP